MRCRKYRREGRRALLKDPIALFSAEWIAQTFGAQVVVLIRHPAAFVSSLIKADWRHPFEDFLNQPQLMEHHLEPFRFDMERVLDGGGIVKEGTLLWRVTHHMIQKYRQSHPGWLFVRHEDLSRDPEHGFACIYEYLGLQYTAAAQETVRAYTRRGNRAEREQGSGPAVAKLDSRQNIGRWRQRLTPQQIATIREGSADEPAQGFTKKLACSRDV